jgi:hypothetical protein
VSCTVYSLFSLSIPYLVQPKAHGHTGLSNTSHPFALLYSVSTLAGICLHYTYNLESPVVVTLLSVMLDNTGFIKAGPKQSEFEPQPGKTVKFSDVHGVDEAKEVGSRCVQVL